MKKTIISLISLLAVAATTTNAAAQSGIDVKITVKNYPNAPVVMGYYFNKQMLVKDTVYTDANCVARIAEAEKYPEGIYMVYIPDRSYFDIIMGADQTFHLTCDTLPNMAARAQVTGCQMLSDFIDYQKYLNDKQKQYKELSDRYKAAGKDSPEAENIRNEFKRVDNEVKQRNEEVIAANADNFLSVFLRGLKDIQIPEFTTDATGHERDSILQVKRYYYYREHAFDNIDLTDDRILRTPYFVEKMDKYFTETVPQIPDTVAAEAIKFIEKTRSNKEMFRYVVSHLYNMTNNSKIMGMDAALVALADKYYLSGLADWPEQKFLDDLREQVENIRYTLIGRKAMDLNMISYTDEWFRLSEVDAPYTILVFWEPSCGHCKKEIPQLKTEVWDKLADKGVKVYAVYCQVDKKEWTDFVTEHHLEEWMNVYDPYGRSGYRKYYNIKSTPQFFVLDKDKKIVAKKIGVEQIREFIEYMLENNKG